jgi:hypothetical protein
MTKAERLAEVEAELAKLQKEHDSFSKALSDPKIVAWIADRGRAAPRSLTAFEIATIKRIATLEPKIDDLETQRDELLAEVICGIASVPADSDINDPEILLRASAVSLSRLHKAGHASPESLAILKALVFYLRSLIEDEDPDDE